MSIAFQAFVLVTLALPGIILRRFFSRAGRFRLKRSVTEEFSRNLITAVALNSLWACLFQILGLSFGLQIDLDSVMMLSMGHFGHEDASFDRAIRSVTDYPGWVLLYFLSLYATAAIAGGYLGAKCAARSMINGSWLGTLYRFIEDEPKYRRVQEWLSHFEFNSERDAEAAAICSMIVVVGGHVLLYVGRMEEEGIIWNDDGNPDRFVLKGAMRRPLEKDDSEGAGFYKIDGDLLVIKASDTVTFNVWWVLFTEAEPPVAKLSAPTVDIPLA